MHNPSLRELMKVRMEMLDYDPISCTNADELRTALSTPTDALVMDLNFERPGAVDDEPARNAYASAVTLNQNVKMVAVSGKAETVSLGRRTFEDNDHVEIKSNVDSSYTFLSEFFA